MEQCSFADRLCREPNLKPAETIMRAKPRVANFRLRYWSNTRVSSSGPRSPPSLSPPHIASALNRRFIQPRSLNVREALHWIFRKMGKCNRSLRSRVRQTHSLYARSIGDSSEISPCGASTGGWLHRKSGLNHTLLPSKCQRQIEGGIGPSEQVSEFVLLLDAS